MCAAGAGEGGGVEARCEELVEDCRAEVAGGLG